ncbi:hypothetical protein Q2941_36490 [Bradyrhizobium sp. UFLA05-153]
MPRENRVIELADQFDRDHVITDAELNIVSGGHTAVALGYNATAINAVGSLSNSASQLAAIVR